MNENEKKLSQEQIKEINETGFYDFICNNYYKMSKDTLKDLFKEFIYAVYKLDANIEKQAIKEMINEINEEN